MKWLEKSIVIHYQKISGVTLHLILDKIGVEYLSFIRIVFLFIQKLGNILDTLYALHKDHIDQSLVFILSELKQASENSEAL